MAAIGHNDCIPQNVSLDTLAQCLEPLSQEPIRINVFFKPPNRKIFNPDGTPKLKKNGEQEVKVVVSKYREYVAEFPTRDEFDSWIEGQSKSTVGTKGSLGITNLSFHGTRQEYSFHSTNRTYLDCDSSDPESFKRVFDTLAPTGLRFSVHESSGSVRRRTMGQIPMDSPPVKWHLDLALSKTILNPLAEIHPMGETEEQFKARKAALPKDDLKRVMHRDGYLRDEWKRKQRFLSRWVAKAAEILNLETGGPGFDLTVSQMCQFRYVGVKFSADGPDPVVWNSRGQLALNFEKFLDLAGYVPSTYTPWQPRQSVIKISNADGTMTTYSRSGGYEDLDNEIQRRLSMDEFLSVLVGIAPDSNNGGGSVSWTCPLPQHPDPKERTLETDRAHAWDGDWWKCRGDCAEIMGDRKAQGGVIKFARLFWGISQREARVRLARHLGLNPADYRGKVEKLDGTFEETTDQTVRVKLASSATESPAKKLLSKSKEKKVRKAEKKAKAGELANLQAIQEFESQQRKEEKAFHAKRGANTAAWVAANMHRFKDRDSFFLAMVKMLILAQETEKDVDVIASTLWESFRDLYSDDRSAILFEVVNTYERILAGAPSIGSGFIKEKVRSWERLELARALSRDGYSFKPMLKCLVGFGLTVGEDRDYLNDLGGEHDVDSGLVPNPHDPESPEFAKHEKKRTAFKNAFRRPGVCCLCDQIMSGSGGRNLGPPGTDGQATPLKRKIVCNTKICLFCCVLQTVSESELLPEMWEGKISKKKPKFVVKGAIEKIAYIKAVKKDLSYVGDAKLSILGWGSNGKPELTVFVNNEAAALSVKSAISAAQQEAAAKEGKPLAEYPAVSYERVTDVKKAIDIALAAKISFNVHGRRLLEEQRGEELTAWLWWSVGKVPVRNPQKEDALHWPTNAMVQAKCKQGKDGEESWEPELWPGEVATYVLQHRKTGYILARRKKIPYGIDDAYKHMKINSGFRYAQSQLEAAEAAAAGRVVINMTTHRVTLGGAVTRSA